MMDGHHDLDAHEQPSDELRLKWKSFAKVDQKIVMKSPEIDDLRSPEKAPEFVLAGSVPVETLNKSFSYICPEDSPEFRADKDAPIYYHPILPGLLILPNIIPPEVQKQLLRNIIHRDLNQPHHQTNMHLHFKLPYPPVDPETGAQESFFSYPPDSDTCFEPKDPSVHKALTFQQVFNRKLHWVTLGGQYDWTNRVYPGELPPEFPKDIAGFLETLFPETLAQAAIVNFYTPGDTMMMHRDVSEETDKGLVSLSIGCDSLFMICPKDWGKKVAKEGEQEEKQEETEPATVENGNKSDKKFLLLRLRSGDVIYMTKESRFAWHGVPKIFKGTCPEWLEDWPAEDGKYEAWKGWMKNKRININVRQMRD